MRYTFSFTVIYPPQCRTYIPWDLQHKYLLVSVLVTQRARVRSPVGTSFLGEVFSEFFLTCKTNVRKLQAHKVPEYHLAIIIIHRHFIAGASDLRC